MHMLSIDHNKCILFELDCLSTKFVALEQENQRLLRDLQQISVEKAQHDKDQVSKSLSRNQRSTYQESLIILHLNFI